MKEAKQLFFKYKGDRNYLHKYKEFGKFDLPDHVILNWKNDLIDEHMALYKSNKTTYYNFVEDIRGVLKGYNDVSNTVQIIDMAYKELTEIDLFLWEMVINWFNEIINSIVFSYNDVGIDKKRKVIESLEQLITSVINPDSHVNDYVYGHICKKYELSVQERSPLKRIQEALVSIKDIKLVLENADENIDI